MILVPVYGIKVLIKLILLRKGGGGMPTLMLKLDEKLYAGLKSIADNNKTSVTGAVLKILADEVLNNNVSTQEVKLSQDEINRFTDRVFKQRDQVYKRLS